MDLDGYNHIKETLHRPYWRTRVTPVPQPEENISFITIETKNSIFFRNITPGEVLQALGAAGLLLENSDESISGNGLGRPKLEPVAFNEHSITFNDRGISER